MSEPIANTTENIIDNKIADNIKRMNKIGNLSKAIEFCQSALKSDPTNPELHVRLGDLYLQKHFDIYQPKRYLDEIINHYQIALESNLNSDKIHYKLGLTFYHQGNIEKAVNHLGISLEYNPKNSDAHLMMAKIMLKRDRVAEGLTYLEKAIKFGGLKASRAHYLYSSLNLRGKSLQSLYHLTMSMLKLPFDREAQRELSAKINSISFLPVYLKGHYLEKTSNYIDASDLYMDAIEKAPGYIPLYLWLGNVYRTMGRTGEALNEYRMAIWLDPMNVYAYKLLCTLYEETADYAHAIETYYKLIEMNPNDAIYHSNLANIFYLKGDIKSAVSHYQTAIALNPNRHWTSIIAQTLGYIFHESKDNYDAAISAYQSATILNPTDIDIYLSLGSAYYDKGDYINALNTYRMALEIDPNNPRIHCNLGFLLWGKGDIEEAVREYEKAISLDVKYDIAYNNLGVIYLDNLGYIEKAADCLTKAIKCNNKYALAHYNLGRALALKGDKVEAARYLQLALDINSHTNELDSMEIKAKLKELFE